MGGPLRDQRGQGCDKVRAKQDNSDSGFQDFLQFILTGSHDNEIVLCLPHIVLCTQQALEKYSLRMRIL